MQWEIDISANSKQPYVNINDLSGDNEVPFPNYALCLPRYSRLDGNYQNAPDNIPQGGYGYVSSYISNENGIFIDKPVITVAFARQKTSNGILLAFNNMSGDYCDSLNIKWYKDEELISEKNFYPDATEYYCKNKVGLFDRLVITFNSTNKPYRYLFLSMLKNERLTKAGGLKIVYDDIALGAKEDSMITGADKDYYVSLENLKRDDIGFPNYALCLPRYSRMDGNFENAPDEINDVGYVSNSISDGNGDFADPPIIEITFSQKYTSVGISLQFNDYSEDYCSLVNIKWYKDGEVISDKDFRPDNYQYFCNNKVEYYNKIVITLLKTSKPHRKAFLTKIDYGLQRNFTDVEAKDVKCLMEISPISEVLSINTLNFTLRSKTDIAFSFQKKQQVKLYFDENLLGIFFVKKGNRTSLTDYYVETQDAIGILNDNEFKGGIYNGITVGELVGQIFLGKSIAYYIDETLVNMPIYGYLPICTERDALAQIGFAIGAVIDTSFDENVYIYPKQEEVSADIKPTDMFIGSVKIERSNIVTGVKLTVHSYCESTETEELFNQTLTGTAKLTFSEPHHSYSITGGEILESGANYAIITGTGETVVLIGCKYNHVTHVVEKKNPDITDMSNMVSVEKATLVTAQNVEEVINRVYDYYTNSERISSRILLKDFELGQKVNIDTDFEGLKTGTIEKLNLKFTQEITAEVSIR